MILTMKTIEDVIYSVFERVGYSRCEIFEGLCLYSHNSKSDYWIVQNYEADFLDKKQGEIHKQFCAHQLEPGQDRNASMLVLVNMDAISLTNEAVVAIENDPFFFKKYVLCYSQKALEQLNGLLKDGKTLEELALNKSVFECLKNNGENSGYQLLYSIVHKMPMISLDSYVTNCDSDNTFNPSGEEKETIGFIENLKIDDLDAECLMVRLKKQIESVNN